MLKIRQYIRAKSLEEAYTLCQKKGSVVLGGMLWLKMQDRPVNTAIDLCDLGLDQIEDMDTEYRIGAMVTLRDLETNPMLNAFTQNAMAECLSLIVGVQFRNLATIGGSLWGKFGFSDPLTLFLALGAKLEFYHRGLVSLEDWLHLSAEPDILTHVILPKRPVQVAYRTMRNTATDFPVLTCAVCQKEDGVVCAIGARPASAVLFRDEKHILAEGITAERADAFAADVAERATFGSNVRASAEYRKKICQVLVRRALLSNQEEA